jgi:hypothetical protein
MFVSSLMGMTISNEYKAMMACWPVSLCSLDHAVKANFFKKTAFYLCASKRTGAAFFFGIWTL